MAINLLSREELEEVERMMGWRCFAVGMVSFGDEAEATYFFIDGKERTRQVLTSTLRELLKGGMKNDS